MPHPTETPGGSGKARLSPDWIALAIVALSLVLRIHSAATSPYEGIEIGEYIRGAEQISASYLPIRDRQHGALTWYLIRLSGEVFGKSPLGYRTLPVLFGTATVWLVFLIGSLWWGHSAGRWSALLLAVDRYHATVTARAVDLGIDLFFITLAMWAFSHFLHGADGDARSESRLWLPFAGAAAGVAFLCKEISVLLVPVFLLTLLTKSLRSRLRTRDPWLALAIFLLVISPDVLWTLSARVAEQPSGTYMNYADHLSRFAGIGPSLQPWLFYFGSLVEWLGVPHINGFAEFPFVYLATGVLLWIAVFAAARHPHRDLMTLFSLIMFGFVFFFFALLRTGPPDRPDLMTDPGGLWYWVDRTMLPAILLAGSWLSRQPWRRLRAG